MVLRGNTLGALFAVFSLALAASTGPPRAMAQASFEVLPFERPFGFGSQEAALFLGTSSDGRTVVGSRREEFTFAPYFATRWDEDTGATDLETLGAGDPFDQSLNFAFGISADGSRIVGEAAPGFSGEQAVYWDADGSLTSLASDLTGASSRAVDVSADGSVLIGLDSPATVGGEALGGFIWDAQQRARSLASLAGYSGTVVPRGLSDDGQVVIGLVEDVSPGPNEAFRWTEAGGLQRLGFLGDGEWSEAYGISADGLTVVGAAEAGFPISGEAFKWTEATGMVGLGQVTYAFPGSPGFPQTTLETTAYAASADGSVVVGGPTVAWLHAEEYGGMIAVRDLLIQLGVTGLENWNLHQAVDVSADGRVITGWGQNFELSPNNLAWRAVIPEPTTALLLGLGLAGLSRRRSEPT